MLTLYFAPGSSSMAVHIALHEIGAKFESRPLSFARKETRQTEFLKLNPQGQVPVLVADGRVLTEVAAILFYLAKTFPEAKLLPEGGLAVEAEAISWMSFLAAHVHLSRWRGVETAREMFGLADRRLGSKDWALGTYSIADIHLFRLFWRNRAFLKAEAGGFANLVRHHERMMARAAVKKTIEVEAAIGYELPA